MSVVACSKRLEDWPDRLIVSAAHHAALPTSWGRSDCYLLGIDAVRAMTGREPWPEVRGSYRTEAGAARQLRRRGFQNVAEMWASAFPEIPVSMAGRGDLGVVRVPEGAGWAGVLFLGPDAVGKPAGGIGTVKVPRELVARAFRIG